LTRKKTDDGIPSNNDFSDAKKTNKNSIPDVDDEEFINKWKIIGLMQRLDRRIWFSHGQIMDACCDKFTNQKHKVLCVLIDIGSKEFRSKPKLHVAAHSTLSALVGIHGAQLTEAVSMKPSS
jgi:hypothetical protein